MESLKQTLNNDLPGLLLFFGTIAAAMATILVPIFLNRFKNKKTNSDSSPLPDYL